MCPPARGGVVSGFYHPESVFLAGKYIYVSNIGSFNNCSKDGFISRLSVSGEVLNFKFIGSLISPKGIWVYKDRLYIADVTRVCITPLSGVSVKCIPVPGSRFLNDIVVVNGDVYVTDTFTGYVYEIRGKRISHFSRLFSPNGIVFSKELNAFIVVSFAKPIINIVSRSGSVEKRVFVHGFTGFDGITICNGSVYISDYKTGKILRTTTRFRKFSVVMGFAGNVSDIYCAHGVFLVPILSRNRVVIFKTY